MAGQKFSLITNALIPNTLALGNGRNVLLSTTTIPNNQGSDGYLYDSLRLVVSYGSYIGSYSNSVRAIVESSNGQAGVNEQWFPVAYQFEGYYGLGGDKREIVVQPNLIVMDAGVDDLVWDGTHAASISRQQGKLGSEFRVSLVLNETAHGTADAFQSVAVSMYGEMFNALN